jgi:type II secretory pathway pseudopilin PulG
MKNFMFRKQLVIAIIIIVVLAAVGGGVWYWQKYSEADGQVLLQDAETKQEEAQQDTNEQDANYLSNRPEGAVLNKNNEKYINIESLFPATIGWDVYYDSQYEIGFQYPTKWSVKKQTSDRKHEADFYDENNSFILSISMPMPETGFEVWDVTDTKIIPTNDDKTNLRYEYLKARAEGFSAEVQDSVKRGEQDMVLVAWLRGSTEGVMDSWKGDWNKTGLIIYKSVKNLDILNNITQTFRFAN